MRCTDLIYPVDDPPKVGFPLIPVLIKAGFPSPAEDYTAKRIDLNEYLIKHPGFTFFIYAEGDSMDPDIRGGDLLVIDRAADVVNGAVVAASIDNEYCVKKFYSWPDGSIQLVSTNPAYTPINIPDESTFEVFGKVICAIQIFK